MKILMVSPEVAPFAKVGGLGDMVSALSKELDKMGHEIRIVCPKYGFLETEDSWHSYESPLYVRLGKGELYAHVWETHIPGSNVIVNFIEYDHYFHRHEIYAGPWGDHKDNDERFTFLSRSSIDLCYFLEWYPNIIHCHDWTTGLIPIYLNTTEIDRILGNTSTVFTIHNLAYQGIFSQHSFDFTGLPESTFSEKCLEAVGCMNMLKGGLYNATKITTVSPNYAQEIQGREHGHGLDGLLRARSHDLHGILNGVDYSEWSPKTDKYIPKHFSTRSFVGKKACKAALQKHFGLEENPDIPIFASVSRFAEQKGLDVLARIIPSLLNNMNIQIITMGSGDHVLQETFTNLGINHYGKMGVHIGYDNPLSHLIEAGADFFLMPSRFEPCGLNQMYSMAYGTLPIARATGGLADTIENYAEGKATGTGFLFDNLTEDALYNTIGWACSTYFDRPKEFKKLRKNAMEKDFSWEISARRYEEVYEEAVTTRVGKFGSK